MSVKLYRVQQARYWRGRLQPAFQPAGRWHKGRSILYLAENAALAAAECVRGLHGDGLDPREMVPIPLLLIELDLALPTPLPEVDPATLPQGWHRIPSLHSITTQEIGNAWLDRRDSLALRVPATALQDGFGWNVLINPSHPDYPNDFPPAQIRVVPFDLRRFLGLPANEEEDDGDAEDEYQPTDDE